MPILLLRRALLRLCVFGLAASLAASLCIMAPAHAQIERAHGLSLLDVPALARDFAHLPYVNPRAPKGGTVRIAALGSFDSLNPFLIRGNAAEGLGLIYDTLMAENLDEPASVYGLIASHVSAPADLSSATFFLRRAARFHDGEPITAEDVAFSLTMLKTHHPSYQAYYKDVVRAEIVGPHEVRFHFAQPNNRELPFIIAQLPILPQHYWADREFNQTTLEPPLGSGPYKIGALNAGRSIAYQRVEEYWARDLNIQRGQHNFDRIQYVYFGDGQIAFEALKGGELDFRYENHSRNWATGYEIDAVRSGALIRKEIAHKQGTGMQGFVLNLRRPQFQDVRVREALNLAFDFEWSNRMLFHGAYIRTDSYFSNSELAARGLPSAAERKLLQPWRAQLPPALFTEIWRNPRAGTPAELRANLRRAAALLRAAGWEVRDGMLQKNGQPFALEFLIFGPAFERIITPYQRNLKRLGIDSSVRQVDASQYQNRLRDYDFDVVIGLFGQSLSPGNEQRDFWSSAAAARKGGRNLIGLADPVVDALVEKLILAKDRAALIVAARALDRVLLWGHYVVPHWHIASFRLAWRRGLTHQSIPAYAHGFPAIWWWER